MPRQELCSTTILLLLSTNQIWIVPDMNDALLLGSLLGESPRCQSSLGTGKEKEYPQESRKNSPYQQGGVSHSMDTVKASVSFCYGERQGMLDMYFFYLFIINYAPNQFLVPSAILQQRCCNCVIETISRLLRIPRPITLQHIVAAGILIKLIQGLICKATSIRLEPHIDKPFIAFPKFISGNVRIPVVPTNGGFRIH
jgi:hypothetical protein